MSDPAVDLSDGPGTDLGPSSSDGSVCETGQAELSITLEDGSTYLLADPGSLIIGPNVRTDADLAKDFKNFAQDVGRRGVKAPVRARRNADGELVVIEGQMRVRAAISEGKDQVRVLVEPGLVGDEASQEIDRIVDQLSDNHHRTANTEADELRATQRLLELGMTARSISTRRSIPRRRAQTLVTVARSAAGAESVTTGIADLLQATVFAEFDGDEQAIATLTECLHTDPDRFNHVAQRLRDDREETRLRAEATARLVEQGVTVLDEPLTYGGPIRPISELRATAKTQPGTRLTPSRHAKCPGHAAYLDYSSRRPVDKRIEIVYVCADFREHQHPLLWASTTAAGTGATLGSGQRGGKMTEEQKAERRTVIRNSKAWDSATTVRRAWLTDFAARKTPPKDAARWITHQWAQGSPALRTAMEQDHPLALELLGLTAKDGRSRWNRGVTHPIADAAATATPARATMLSLVLLLAALEDSTDRRRTWDSPSRDQIAYFTQLAEWGYPLDDVEKLVLAHATPAPSPTSNPQPDDQPAATDTADDHGTDHQDPSDVADRAELAPAGEVDREIQAA